MYTDILTIKNALPPRPENAHKGTFGTLLSVSGCYSMAGAAVMAARAALRSGLGLMKCALPKSIYPIAAQAVLESVFLPMNETADGHISRREADRLISEAEKADAVLVGPGLGNVDDTRLIVRELVLSCSKPLVLDADGLNCISASPALLSRAKAPVIITPHPGEMSRLTGKTTAEINLSREQTALEFSDRYGVVTVLKGSGTVIASPGGKYLINPTGNCGMASGGSGDVLSGILGALSAQGTAPFEAAAAAVYIHGLAGDYAAESFGTVSMLPTDIIENIYKAFAKVLSEQ